MDRISNSLLVLCTVFGCGLAQAQSSDFVVTNIHVDNVRQPKNVFDILKECSNDAGCVAVLKAMDNYFQIPVSKFVTVGAAFSVSQAGEGTYVNTPLPSGYAYCKSAMKIVSIVPHDGDRGSTFLGRSDANGLYYETWTPVLPPGQGRSWVEAGISIVGVRQDLAASSYANGSCFRPGPGRILWYCRGGGCTETADQGQSKDASSRPGANSAK